MPEFSRDGAFIVNCAISPRVSLEHWPYQQNSGLGGSAAWALLNGKNPVESELGAGVGWQDPAVIIETGLCVWRSGPRPVLDMKVNPDWLLGRMAIFWTNIPHDTAALAVKRRDYTRIADAGYMARQAVVHRDFQGLMTAVSMSYHAQISEGMTPLPEFAGTVRKYVGSGHGGYAVYLFTVPAARPEFLELKDTLAIEPYLR